MGKTKPAKKPASPLKISTTSLFRRRSKNSTGQVDKESSPPGKSGKGVGKGGKGGGKGKAGGKEGSKQSSSRASSASSSSSSGGSSGSPTKKQPPKKKTPVSPKKGSAAKAVPAKKASKTATPSQTKKSPGKGSTQSPVKGKTSAKSKVVTKERLSVSSGRKDKSPSPRGRGGNSRRKSRSSSSSSISSERSSSPSNQSSSESTTSSGGSERHVGKKITTRKRSKSDAEQQPSSSSGTQQKMAKSNEGESSKKSKNTTAKSPVGGKKGATTTKASASTTSVAKKVAKKAASIVASKKKTLPVKLEKAKTSKASPKSTSTSSSQADKSKGKVGKKNANASTMKKVKGTPSSTAKGTKSMKVKPRPKTKLRRMASLNAKAILEASFSFEPQEKKQRSPAPSSVSVMSKGKNTDDILVKEGEGKDYDGGSGRVVSSNVKPIIGSSTSHPKGNDDHDVMSVSVSTSTSPPPPPSAFSPVQGKSSGERKRKSSETPSRRESTASNKSSSAKGQSKGDNYNLNVGGNKIKSSGGTGGSGNSGSRRNSTGTTTNDDGNSKMSKKNRKESPSPKKKTKVGTTSTSTTTTTSTSTSPLLSPEFYAVEGQADKKVKQHKPKKEKNRSQESGTNTFSGSKNQDTGVQIDYDSHHSQAVSKSRSAGCQAKEKKSTPVAQFGTVYQPAGPLIEPHKTPECMPSGLETVKLPPDLKVTYQTHPPSSNPSVVSTPHSSNYSPSKPPSKKVSSSSSSTSTSSHPHHQSQSRSEKSSSSRILHQPYKSSASTSSSSVGTGTSHHSSSPQQPQSHHHQQSSSSSSASSSTSLPRSVQANYPGTSYVISGANTGSPLLSNSSAAAAMLSQQQQSAAAALLQQQHQQLASSALGGLGGHHHPIGSPVGPSHQPPQPPSVSAGAPSAGGLFYSTSAGFAPHHSPFAPCKYPMVPPDSYRTHSPYPNSFLYPSATPQPSGQSYFMTPFYTPPLTPNAAPTVVTGGLGGGMGVGANQPRPLSLAHHPSVAAASLYHPQGGPPPPPSAHHHPSNYLVASPHHSIQPSPTAPGHAGLFHPNQSTQPACPCPTESYPLSSTNSNSKQQLQPQSVSSVSLPGLEVGVNAKHPKSQSQQALVSVTATRPSRHSTKDVPLHHPPTCTTPAVAADPPVTIQLLNSNVNVKQTQDRQLESAKTFTEQYSLPDDITITPIIVSNANTNSALLLINSSISIVTTSAPSSLNSSGNSSVNCGSNSSSPSKSLTKKKEKDIVHLIDPRSGHKTTIAKHISTKNLLASSTNGSPTKSRSKSPPKERSIPGQTSGSASAVSRLKSNINKIGSIKVGKLNPDLDVIVINNRASGSNADGGDVNGGGSDLDHISQNGKLIHERMQNQKQQTQRSQNSKGGVRTQGKMGLDQHHHHPNQPSDKDLQSGPMPNSSNLSNQQVMQVHQNKPVPKGNRGQMLPRRIALVGSDNNSQHKLVSKKGNSGGKSPEKSLSSSNPPFSYSLPPGISISPGVGANLSITPAALHNNSQNVSVRPMTVQNYQRKCDSKSLSPGMQQVLSNQKNSSLSKKGPNSSNKKRISLNECIDGLQKKRMKLLEDHNMLGGNGSSQVMRGGSKVPGVLSTTTTPYGRLDSGIVFPINKANLARNRVHDAGATSARVRDPEGFSMGSTVIKSSDAIVAVSALVVDPASYHAGRNARAAAAMTAAVRGHNKNGLKRANGNKLQQQSRKNHVQSSVHGKKVGSSSSGGVGSLKVKLKGLEKVNGGGGGARSTRSSAANAKIRTRLSTKPKLSGEGSSGVNSRSRSRLLRQRNQIISAGNTRKSESDCSSTNTSRSSSAVRLAGGNGPSGGKVERGNKYSTQAYINAVADLYQYRRNVMLRVPKAGVGIFPSASSVKLLNIPGNSSSSCGGRSASISPGQQGIEKKIGGNSSQQLSPGNSQNVLSPQLAIGGSSSRSNSPSLPSANMGTSTSKGPVGSMAASAAKKRAVVKPLSPSAVNGALLQLGVPRRQPKWSNGWRFEGEPYEAKVLVNNDDQPVLRVCYPAMRHESGDVIQTRDCVLLKSGSRKNDLPYIAKIAALWENPSDGEMMFSLLWYYRPEHTEMGRTKDDMMDEVFASKHIDVNSVATIDDRCYVLTFNEYCRYRKRLKQLEDGLPNKPLLTITGSSMINNNAAGNIACAVWSGRASSEDPTRAPSPGKISPEVVFFCRKVYDFRQKRIMKNPS